MEEKCKYGHCYKHCPCWMFEKRFFLFPKKDKCFFGRCDIQCPCGSCYENKWTSVFKIFWRYFTIRMKKV